MHGLLPGAPRNRLTKIVESLGDLEDPLLEINYRYDVFDRLVWRAQTDYHHADGGEGGTGEATTTVSVERRFYDGDHVVLDFIQDGWGEPIELRHRYLYGPAVDQVLAQEDVLNSHDPYLPTNTTLWLLADNQGTIRDIVDNAGSQMTRGHFQYDAYGQIVSDDSDKALTRYLYTGRDFDATTGLQYNRARWYDSFTGRWTTQDPIGFAAGDYNLYRYVGNSPTNGTDPSGTISRVHSGASVKTMPLAFEVFWQFTLDTEYDYPVVLIQYVKASVSYKKNNISYSGNVNYAEMVATVPAHTRAGVAMSTMDRFAFDGLSMGQCDSGTLVETGTIMVFAKSAVDGQTKNWSPNASYIINIAEKGTDSVVAQVPWGAGSFLSAQGLVADPTRKSLEGSATGTVRVVYRRGRNILTVNP